VLLMLAPAAPLLLLDRHFFCWVQILGCFTMFPLLAKDKLRLPYLACCGMYVVACATLLVSTQDNRGGPEAAGALWAKVCKADRTRSWAGYVEAVQDFLASATVKTLLLALAWTGKHCPWYFGFSEIF